jgi:hypothetical protein
MQDLKILPTVNVVRILGFMMMLIVGLSLIRCPHFIFIPISAISLFIGLRQFIADFKELKSSMHYCRVPTSYWKSLAGMIFTIVAVIGTFYLPKKYLDLMFSLTSLIHIMIIYLTAIFADNYQKFINSIRAFENGIKLPGRNQELIRGVLLRTYQSRIQ